jgi:hypothetical protein
MDMHTYNQKKSWSGGYTLLFAVLVSAIVLGVAVSILNIARKELILTSGARESQFAFYAADTGYECAEWYDSNTDFFSTTTWQFSSPQWVFGDGHANVQCNSLTQNSPVNWTVTNSPYQFEFFVPISSTTGGPCADVIVTKQYQSVTLADGSVLPNVLTTTIDSKGYNVGWNPNAGVPDLVDGTRHGDCSTPSLKKVERALHIVH